MDSEAHFSAVLARLREHPALTVEDSEMPTVDGVIVRASYVVLHDLGPDEIHTRYTADSTSDSARTMRVVARCVGVDPAAVRRVRDAVAKQLGRWAPQVPGRVCERMQLVDESEVQADRKIQPPLWWADLDFTYRTSPGG